MVDAGGAPIDRYVVLEHLSEGGMGAIYVGKKLGAGGFEMEVVLKQLLPEFTQQEEFIDLFLREAKLSATLDHANIVHTIDLVTAGGEYFIVMEYLPGGDLRSLLKRAKRRGKRFSPSAAIRICRETLSALAYAHVKRDFSGQPLRLIHRDVSPSNILLSFTGEVKLTDFGIAKAATHNSLFYKVKGKIGYMSPEQARSEPLDHRSDLYSLAVCLYEVLTGERLFVHAGITTPADEIYSQPIPQLSRKVPGLSADFDAIIAKALSIDPDARYQTASEFQEALTRCAHRNGLLMAAPELARELLDACGPIDQWRSEDDDDDLGYVERAGTEVYDALVDPDEDEDAAPVSIHSIAGKLAPRMPPRSEVSRFAGLELTSIINVSDIEIIDGAKPLVDLNLGPKLDSGPLHFESGLHARFEPPARASAPVPPRPEDAATVTGRPPRDLVAPMVPPSVVTPPPALSPPSERGSGPGFRIPPQQALGPPAFPLPPGGFAPPRIDTRAKRGPRNPTAKSRSIIRPWMVIFAILLAAGIAAGIVALSGPAVEVKDK
ncbi:MAG: serine/threonine protein kinase [Kofleriaceae bacterium]